VSYKTEQEEFWLGKFGNDYKQRNQGVRRLGSRLNFFSNALKSTNGIKSCIEFGANIGLNLEALNLLYPNHDLYGIEINESATQELAKVIPSSNIFHTSILDFNITQEWDLVLIKGVLIHINPNVLTEVYAKLTQATTKYILIAEYYNPTPVSIPYRGHSNRLFKRDFTGDILDKYPEFKLIDYGFVYHKDPNFPLDDVNWFLLEKTTYFS